MISADAKLTICKVPLRDIHVCEYEERYPDQLMLYIKKLKAHPKEYAGLLFLVPSCYHPGTFALLDGYHKFCASIMTGRYDALAVVIEEEETPPSVPFEEWHDEAIRERIPHVRPRTQYQRYREMGHNQVGALLMVIENLVYAQGSES